MYISKTGGWRMLTCLMLKPFFLKLLFTND